MLRATIAIDGPVAAGKSTVGRLLAERLGYRYVDTGAYYRALTWLALRRGVDPEDEASLADLARSARIQIQRPTVPDGRAYTVLVDGQDVTWAIRSPEVEGVVSIVARQPSVRRVLVEQQRELAQAGQVVMVGRDIGTVVLPDAELKIFLSASAEERAARRYCELATRAEPASYRQILEDLRQRDQIDRERAVGPLRPADDAQVVDTDGLSVEQVIDRIQQLILR
ncbi:MAG: (d)CMP kinase [Chloroflexi bacterium]|nr:(d)CMP kinase [Chloroflexota bacterium]